MVWAGVVVLASLGCGGLNPYKPNARGPDDPDGASDTDTDADADADSDADSDADTDALLEAFPCADLVAEGTLPETIQGSNNGAGDQTRPSCLAQGGGNDVGIVYTAPTTADYVFDLEGSRYDTVLAVMESCSGPELECNDDWLPGLISQTSLRLTAGESVLLVVDAWSGEQGTFQLNVEERESAESDCTDGRDLDHDQRIDCVDPDCDAHPSCDFDCADGALLGDLPVTGQANTSGQGDDHTPGCGSSSSADLAFLFTAPINGTYQFDTSGSDFDTILYALDACRGSELACNDDGGPGRTSQLQVQMAQGQTVMLVVDGYNNNNGAMTLNAGLVAP